MKPSAQFLRAVLALVSTVLLASSAHARNEQFLLQFSDAMKKTRAREIVGDIPVRFGSATAATVAKTEIVRTDVVVDGEGSTGGDDPRQRHFERLTDEQICIHAFEAALTKLMVIAREEKAGAVLGVVSDYRGNVIDDARTFECRAGAVRSYVSLRAQISRAIPLSRPLPSASGFADIANADAVPLSDEGKERYRHFLTLPQPRAFVVFEDGHWYMTWHNGEAMTKALDYCARVGKRCWLYAADDRVVWDADPAKRIGASAQLKGSATSTGEGE